ncbi:hypothetical protein PABG_12560 [Paracoccidioides brasiliensis Pb03]|nr:hypothetical protein PABG_12560 [Paracoccidioides brasiliensis Pb03]
MSNRSPAAASVRRPSAAGCGDGGKPSAQQAMRIHAQRGNRGEEVGNRASTKPVQEAYDANDETKVSGIAAADAVGRIHTQTYPYTGKGTDTSTMATATSILQRHQALPLAVCPAHGRPFRSEKRATTLPPHVGYAILRKATASLSPLQMQ